METRASHVLVGLFVVVLSVATALAAIWFARAQLDRQVDVYEVAFRSSVSGLQNGAQVTYQGIQVGRVARIRFDPDNVERVLVRIEVEPSTPVTEDTIARLEPQGITGIFFVQLSGGSNQSARLPSRPTDPAQIPGRPSAIDRLSADAPELLNRGVLLLERATTLLDETNLERVASTLEDIETLADTAASRREEVAAIIDETAALMGELRAASASAERMLASLETTAGTIERDIEALLASGQSGLARLDEAALALDRAAGQMNGLLRDVREPLRDFSQTGLYEFGALIVETRQLVAAATRITREFERDPTGFLLGNTFKGFRAE